MSWQVHSTSPVSEENGPAARDKYSGTAPRAKLQAVQPGESESPHGLAGTFTISVGYTENDVNYSNATVPDPITVVVS
jgi:hypothetical protein